MRVGGLLVHCTNPSSLKNRANSYDAYSGPLSETTVSGIPCLANMDLMCRITSDDVVSVHLVISTLLLAESTSSKHVAFLYTNMSVPTFCQWSQVSFSNQPSWIASFYGACRSEYHAYFPKQSIKFATLK